MIVSRKSAEGFLGKRLKSLGDVDPSKKRRVSYYVLSSDGTKNLGGPYTKMDAKKRLRQVEFFKRNPSLSSGMKPSDFNRSALAEGTRVELEHTDDRKIAQRIAMDHLAEDPDYYLKLRAIEGEPGPYQLTEIGTAEAAAIGAAAGGVAAGIASPLASPVGAAAGGYIGAELGKRGAVKRATTAKKKATEDYHSGLITKRQMQRVHRESNAVLKSHGERPKKNPRPFGQREHAWDEVLIQSGRKKLTRKQILDYYKKNVRNIWPYLKGQTVIVILAPSKNSFVLRRKRPSDDKHIKLTKLKGIDDERSFEYWIHRRAIEFHPVLTGKMTPILWLDLDMHTTRSAQARARLFEKMKKAAPKIKRVFRKFGVSRIFVYESGQDGGLHFEGDLRKRHNVDKLRKEFTKALDEAFEDDPTFTTGLAKSGQIRLDTTTFHTLGSLRAPFSMTVTGHPKKRITV